jgi:RNA polymerase sigma factor (sigma-70 family)
MKIVRNTCYTWLHKSAAARRRGIDENFFPPDSRTPNPEEVVLQNDHGTLLRKALEKLPPNFREVLIILRELEGMSYREIADITGMPAGTVMSSLSRARGRLRHVLTALLTGIRCQVHGES